MSEAMRIKLESDLQTLRAEVDRLQASKVWVLVCLCVSGVQRRILNFLLV